MKAPGFAGGLLLVAFVFVGEMTVLFHDYLFSRLGLSRNFLLSALWLVPIVAAYIASRYSAEHGALFGLSFILIVPILGSLGHIIHVVMGGVRDLSGIAGALTTFKIYFVIGGVGAVIGTIFGVAFSSRESPGSQ